MNIHFSYDLLEDEHLLKILENIPDVLLSLPTKK